MRLCVCCSLLVLAACEPRRSSPRVLASAEVGPDGGVVEVASGDQAGLRVTVPAGALVRNVRIEVLDDEAPVADVAGSIFQVVYVPPLARPFRVEPADLFFEQPVVLRMPYDPLRIVNSAPGNVSVVQRRPGGSVAYPPTAVDAIAGQVEFATQTLGTFQVERAVATTGLFNYLGPAEATVELAEGWTFVSGPIDAASPFAGLVTRQWRLTGPGLDETWFFDDLQLVGRETSGWRETWNEPVRPWSESTFGEPLSTIVGVQVEAPIGAQPTAGTLGMFHTWRWDVPRAVGDALATEVVRLEAVLGWERADLGTGQRQHVFWFSPAFGLLAIGLDGVVHERTAP